MGFLSALSSIANGIAKPIADVVTAGSRRKQAKEEGLNKIKQAQVDGENSLNLSDAEWEAVNSRGNAESWKDEYVTVTMTAWIWLGLVGAVMSAYGKPEVLEGVKAFVVLCVTNDIELGLLTSAVVTAAVGLKLWRSRN